MKIKKQHIAMGKTKATPRDIEMVEDNELPEAYHSRKEKRLAKLSYLDKRKLKNTPHLSFLVTILFSNGTNRSFVVLSKKETFKYKGRHYYLRYEDAWYDITHKQYRLYYFDDYAVPLDMIPLNKKNIERIKEHHIDPIDRKIIKTGNKDFWTVTSSNLKHLIDMKYLSYIVKASGTDVKPIWFIVSFIAGALIMKFVFG